MRTKLFLIGIFILGIASVFGQTRTVGLFYNDTSKVYKGSSFWSDDTGTTNRKIYKPDFPSTLENQFMSRAHLFAINRPATVGRGFD